MSDKWIRPLEKNDARNAMLHAERNRDYETAALSALAASAKASSSTQEASCERHAIAYALLHQAQTAVWIAENRQLVNPEALQ